MKVKQLVIIGGGSSIKEGMKKDLWNKLQGKFTFSLNYAYNYLPEATSQMFVDHQFYTDNYEDLKKLPLIIGKHHKIKLPVMSNTIMLETISKYSRNMKKGVYKSSLVGIFALTLGIYLLDKEGEIYLLGYDYGGKKIKEKKYLTHFYQGEVKHRGIGKVNYYNATNREDRDFGVYKDEPNIKIYNVSLDSKINTFFKISYDEFFKRLDSEKLDQEELREIIRDKLKEVKKND